MYKQVIIGFTSSGQITVNDGVNEPYEITDIDLFLNSQEKRAEAFKQIVPTKVNLKTGFVEEALCIFKLEKFEAEA